jgi:glyoxylase-like metal-dependent hydrolase (beta-lactamase superfamily II)
MSLIFKQLLAGEDFALNNPTAAQMANFVYVVGDSTTREVYLVDPAWDAKGLLDYIHKQEWKLKGIIASHYHADHIGGSVFGMQIEGIKEVLEHTDVCIHCHKEETQWIHKQTGIPASSLKSHEDGDILSCGPLELCLHHTPGHTPGSICISAQGNLVAGDTLFLNGCGRTDLPGGDPEALFRTLNQKIRKMPGSWIVFPGHHYSVQKCAHLHNVIETNPVFFNQDEEDFI